MTAEEYINKSKVQNQYGGCDITEDDALEAVEMARKEEREKLTWHDLRKNPNDFPEDNTWCVIGWNNRATLLSLYVGNKSFIGDQSGMTEIWMEIPEFK